MPPILSFSPESFLFSPHSIFPFPVSHTPQLCPGSDKVWDIIADLQRDGECFRLFTKEAFDKLIDFDAPEIQRCNLSSAILQLVAMNQDPFTFEYIDNPGREASMSLLALSNSVS